VLYLQDVAKITIYRRSHSGVSGIEASIVRVVSKIGGNLKTIERTEHK
jgi:hypothetical protein